jgi:predicted nucleic acid-binding protein
MRVVDTNILVRAAADEQGLAGRLLQEIASGRHVLVSSPYILGEVTRVLAYVPPLKAVTLQKLQFNGQPRVVCREPK